MSRSIAYKICDKTYAAINTIAPRIEALTALAGITSTATVAAGLYAGETVDEKIHSLCIASIFFDTSMYIATKVLRKRNDVKTLLALSVGAIVKQAYFASLVVSEPSNKDKVTNAALEAMFHLSTISVLHMAHNGLKSCYRNLSRFRGPN